MSIETLWILYLLGAFLLAALAIFLGAFRGNREPDNYQFDVEAMRRTRQTAGVSA
jgi:hypothetical protein